MGLAVDCQPDLRSLALSLLVKLALPRLVTATSYWTILSLVKPSANQLSTRPVQGLTVHSGSKVM